MNNRQIEILAEQERRQILEEVKHIRLEEEAISHVHHTGWFEQKMYQFGSWMINTGQHIRAHYEDPCTPNLKASSARQA